jgi:hypothetical protein
MEQSTFKVLNVALLRLPSKRRSMDMSENKTNKIMRTYLGLYVCRVTYRTFLVTYQHVLVTGAGAGPDTSR